MKNNGFGLIGILVTIFVLLVIGVVFSVVKNTDPREDQGIKSNTTIEINQGDPSFDFEIKPEGGFVFVEDSEKNEIQDLLNKQCQALSNKDLKTLISTVDQTNTDLFQEYTKSTDILLSLIGSVIKCRYEIQDIQFNKDGNKSKISKKRASPSR